MKIVINHGYTYESGDLAIKIGDTAVLPTPSWLLDVKPPTWEGIVTATTSEYEGWCAKVIAVKKTKKIKTKS